MNGAGGRRSLAVNAAWGLGGRVFQTLLQVFVTPIVIRLLGAEGYGVVAFGATLFAIVAMLDFAFGPVVQRLLNQGEASPEERAHTRDLVFTLQLVSFALAALITVILAERSRRRLPQPDHAVAASESESRRNLNVS